jgi:outer membrane lipase/esterase
MNTLKRMTVALLALLLLATGAAFADDEHGYSRIFIFGASFMDSGNHFAFTGETAHPPVEFLDPSYGIGGHHFSNGRTWVEVLAQKMELTEWAKPAWRDPSYGNYAFGHGRAVEYNWDPLPSLQDQVTAWGNNGYCTGDPDNPMYDTLFIVDSGYFDLLDILNGADATTVLFQMTMSIRANIEALRQCGAYHVLLAYLPPLESSPIVPAPYDPSLPSGTTIYNYFFLHTYIVQHFANEPNNLNVSTVDFLEFFNEMLTTPEAYGITNTTDSCVTFGVTKGAFCKNRDEYVFWDPLHPTKKIHALMAEEAYAALPHRN